MSFDSSLHKAFNNAFRAGSAVKDAVIVRFENAREAYDGWQSVAITRDLNSLCSTFSITVADKWRDQVNDEWPFRQGNRVLIGIPLLKKKTNADPKNQTDVILNGFIDTVSCFVSNENRQIQITGRDKTGDIIDSAALGLSSSYKNISLIDLANEYVSKFDIEVKSETSDTNTKIKEVVVNQGETIFELLSRYAKELGVLLTSDRNGNLVITDRRGIVTQRKQKFQDPSASQIKQSIGADQAKGLIQGKNILNATAVYDESSRFQIYLVKAQIKGNDNNNGANANKIQASAQDSLVDRPRVKYVISEKTMDNDAAKNHANWLANIHAVAATDISIRVQGWRNASGELWDLNQIVDCDASFIGLNKQKLLIQGVTYEQTQQGTFTDLRLTRLDAYQSQPEEKVEPVTRQKGKKENKSISKSFGDLAKVAKAHGL